MIKEIGYNATKLGVDTIVDDSMSEDDQFNPV